MGQPGEVVAAGGPFSSRAHARPRPSSCGAGSSRPGRPGPHSGAWQQVGGIESRTTLPARAPVLVMAFAPAVKGLRRGYQAPPEVMLMNSFARMSLGWPGGSKVFEGDGIVAQQFKERCSCSPASRSPVLTSAPIASIRTYTAGPSSTFQASRHGRLCSSNGAGRCSLPPSAAASGRILEPIQSLPAQSDRPPP
jgi:hypothetical protein